MTVRLLLNLIDDALGAGTAAGLLDARSSPAAAEP